MTLFHIIGLQISEFYNFMFSTHQLFSTGGPRAPGGLWCNCKGASENKFILKKILLAYCEKSLMPLI